MPTSASLRRSILIAAVAFAAGPSLCARAADAPKAAAGAFRELRWEELVPKDWDPMKLMREKSGTVLNDASPQALALMREMRDLWDAAPTVAALDGAAVRLPGYLVPLEESRDGTLKEFLLVPYFGACIHTPPPPANQIVHVLVGQGVKGYKAMDTVWVQGRMKTVRGDSGMGVTGYQLEAAGVERYTRPPKQ